MCDSKHDSRDWNTTNQREETRNSLLLQIHTTNVFITKRALPSQNKYIT